MNTPKHSGKSEAAERILSTAATLFYQEGIQSVGIDRIVKEAGVAMNTMYKHFPSKDKLIEAYLIRRDENWRSWFTEYIEQADTPRERLLAVFDALHAWFQTGDFRGCAFINAVGEFGSEKGEVRRIAYEHKEFIRDYIHGLAREVKISDPGTFADQLMLLVEGAIVTAHIGNKKESARQAREVASALLAAHGR
ncbi:TetR/AcrR family transcriptional regulator [Aneurinibacillus tyrosinisolvens]|uniref:TetR/AcrR family transcriptional regulator n=1 Tax=Aneurinibacillus tyrosinisolvens TaxID=1443435 RepID=UPI00063EECC4|nr:TetR/AcrR family transcriptional regulator [Aneurinibacillus tyrosinisolvens]